MLSFKEFSAQRTIISEAISPVNLEKNASSTILDALQSIEEHPVLWRGFKASAPSRIIEVKNDRKTFKGRVDTADGKTDRMDAIMAEFNITQPTFVTTEYDQAKFFGKPRIFLPKGKYRAFHNKDIRDVGVAVSKKEVGTHSADAAISGFEEVRIGHFSLKDEIIFDVDTYWLIDVEGMLDMTRARKFRQIKSVAEVRTYADVEKVVLDFLSWIEWMKRRRESLTQK